MTIVALWQLIFQELSKIVKKELRGFNQQKERTCSWSFHLKLGIDFTAISNFTGSHCKLPTVSEDPYQPPKFSLIIFASQDIQLQCN